MTQYNKVLQNLLKEELALLDKAEEWLQRSIKHCDEIDLNHSLSDEAYDLLDNLSTRFMRYYEVLINQILRTYLNLLGEQEMTRLDIFNKAEKLGLCDSASDLNFCRITRNKIAHEYAQEEWKEIYLNVFQGIKILQDLRSRVKESIAERNILKLD